MKKIYILSLALCIPFFSISQGKYFSRDGKIDFHSNAPVEDIEAHHNQVSSILNTDNGDIVFSMLIKGFEFEKALMQEHFNENYLESDKYPKAIFEGKIMNFPDVDLTKDGSYDLEIHGDLTIHGVTKSYTMPATMERKGESLQGVSNFKVAVADHNIKIPSAVVDNIAEVIDVNVNITYQPYKK